MVDDSKAARKTKSPTPDGDHLLVIGSVPYEATREALYKKKFQQVDNEPWPTALLEHKGALGRAQLRPVVADAQMVFGESELDYWTKAMWRQCEELSDLDADVLDALSAIWLHQANSPRQNSVVSRPGRTAPELSSRTIAWGFVFEEVTQNRVLDFRQF